MKKSTYGMALCAAISTLFSACQMENDLRGSKKEEVGYLQATMLPQSTEPMLTRAASDESYDVNDFPVAILRTEDGDTVRRFDSYRLLKEEGDIALTPGTYRVIAWWGTNTTNVQTTPYFVGETEFEVVSHRTTQVETTCKQGRIKVSAQVSEDFEEAFEDNYTLTFNNQHGIMTMDAASKDDAYYFKVYEGEKAISVSVKATPKGTEKTITKDFTLYKQDMVGDDGNTLDLEAGDAFRIHLTPIDSEEGTVVNPTETNYLITVDLKWNDRAEEVEIPINVVDSSAPSDEQPDDDASGDHSGSADTDADAPVLTPSINGVQTWDLHMEYDTQATLKVDISAPATIQKLVVSISSDNALFNSLVAGMSLTEFDLCHITDADTEESVSEVLELPYNDDVKGQTSFTFDVSGFSNALSGFEGEHRFTLTVTDGNGRQSAGTLVVSCDPDPDLQ